MQRSLAGVTSPARLKQQECSHHSADGADSRGLTQADFTRELDADKSVVSRWFAGATPCEKYQQKLADLFGCSRESLSQHPEDGWHSGFSAHRDRDEIERIKRRL